MNDVHCSIEILSQGKRKTWPEGRITDGKYLHSEGYKATRSDNHSFRLRKNKYSLWVDFSKPLFYYELGIQFIEANLRTSGDPYTYIDRIVIIMTSGNTNQLVSQLKEGSMLFCFSLSCFFFFHMQKFLLRTISTRLRLIFPDCLQET